MYKSRNKYKKNSFVHNKIDLFFISTKTSSIKESRWNNGTYNKEIV